jgi:hypothetical protein
MPLDYDISVEKLLFFINSNLSGSWNAGAFRFYADNTNPRIVNLDYWDSTNTYKNAVGINGNPLYQLDNNWHHYVVIFDKSNKGEIRYYVDGTLYGKTAGYDVLGVGLPMFFLGNGNWLTSNLYIDTYDTNKWTDDFIKYIYENKIKLEY